MKRHAAYFVLGMAFVLCAATTAACDQESEAQQMVDKAAQSFREKGKAHTVKLFNSTAGPFRKGELYVFAMTFDGVFLAHAANREFVGTSQADRKDARGNPLFPPMLETAKNPGSGWVEYWWPRHGEKEPTLKRTYIRRVPGEDILLGAGFYVK